MALTPEVLEENRKIRHLRMIVDLTCNVLHQGNLTLEEAYRLVAAAKAKVLSLFPDKQDTYDLIIQPRFNRILQERFRRAFH